MVTATTGIADTPKQCVLGDGRPNTVMGWINAVKSGEVTVGDITSNCKLRGDALDKVLEAAYKQAGGYPCGV